MKRFRVRKPKNYAWPLAQFLSSADASIVADMPIVVGAQFQGSSTLALQQQRTLNLKRIIGDIMWTVAPGGLGSETDVNVYGAICWCVMIRDTDDDSIYDPETSSISQEKVLAIGITESIGLNLVTDAFVAGSGNAKAFANAIPTSTRIHLDIATNRRLGSGETLEFRWTRQSNAAYILQSDSAYLCHMQVRTLVQLPD